MTLADHLFSLELRLLDPATRNNPEALITLLTGDFREFGASGRIFTRDAILHLLQTEPGYTPPETLNFEARELTPDLALVTYQPSRQSSSGGHYTKRQKSYAKNLLRKPFAMERQLQQLLQPKMLGFEPALRSLRKRSFPQQSSVLSVF